MLTYPHEHLLQRRHGNAISTDNYIFSAGGLMTHSLFQRTKQI